MRLSPSIPRPLTHPHEINSQIFRMPQTQPLQNLSCMPQRRISYNTTSPDRYIFAFGIDLNRRSIMRLRIHSSRRKPSHLNVLYPFCKLSYPHILFIILPAMGNPSVCSAEVLIFMLNHKNNSPTSSPKAIDDLCVQFVNIGQETSGMRTLDTISFNFFLLVVYSDWILCIFTWYSIKKKIYCLN